MRVYSTPVESVHGTEPAKQLATSQELTFVGAPVDDGGPEKTPVGTKPVGPAGYEPLTELYGMPEVAVPRGTLLSDVVISPVVLAETVGRALIGLNGSVEVVIGSATVLEVLAEFVGTALTPVPYGAEVALTLFTGKPEEAAGGAPPAQYPFHAAT